MEKEFDIVDIPEMRLKQLMKMPILESKIAKSKDGKYVVHRTVITDIKPVEYYEKVFSN